MGCFPWKRWRVLNPPNRRGTGPYARWCGRGGIARCPPIPIEPPSDTDDTSAIISTVDFQDSRSLMAARLRVLRLPQFPRDRIGRHTCLLDCRSELFPRHAPFLGPIPDLMVLAHVHTSPVLRHGSSDRQPSSILLVGSQNLRRTIRFKQFCALTGTNAATEELNWPLTLPTLGYRSAGKPGPCDQSAYAVSLE